MRLSPEAENLIAIISGYPLTHEDTTLDGMLRLAERHGIIPLAFNELKRRKAIIPAGTYADLERACLTNLARNVRFWNEFVLIAGRLRQKGIPLVPIKGVDTLTRFYPELDVRCLSDIDVLIKKESLAQARDSLLEMGYRLELYGLKEEYWSQKQCHLSFVKPGFLVEVHWGLDFERGKKVILPSLWERIQELDCGGQRINVLSAEDAFFAFALHLRRFGDILSLKQALDVARIIRETTGFDWEYVLKEGHRGRMRASAYFMLRQAAPYAGVAIPEGITKRLGLSPRHRTLIEGLITRYTFTIRDPWQGTKDIYCKAHFLLYDSAEEALWYVIAIPHEQFCKFYNLVPYTAKSITFYRLRLAYIPIRAICSLFRNSENRRKPGILRHSQ